MSLVDRAVGRYGAAPLPDFTSIFNRGHKDGVLDDMVATVRGLMGAANARRAHAKAWLDVGKAIHAVLVSQNTECEDVGKLIEERFEHMSKQELRLADAQERNADDFRDIIERYDVLFKVNEQWLELREKQKEASADLDAATQAYEAALSRADTDIKKRSKLEQEVTLARARKSHILEKVKQILQKLVDTRIAYTRLKVRRLRHGWALYGRMLKEVAEEETCILREVSGFASQLQGVEVALPAPREEPVETFRAAAPPEPYRAAAPPEPSAPYGVPAAAPVAEPVSAAYGDVASPAYGVAFGAAEPAPAYGGAFGAAEPAAAYGGAFGAAEPAPQGRWDAEPVGQGGVEGRGYYGAAVTNYGALDDNPFGD